METKTDCLIIFVKWPEKGTVKTRLSAALGEDAVLELYKCFVEDIVETVKRTGIRPLIACFPEDAREKIAAWLGDENDYVPQVGADLGTKMSNAFQLVFERGISRAVLIGSDLPDLPAEIISEALSALKRNHAVIGPAKDGGYYLIGFRHDTFSYRIFDGIPWGTPEVLEQTMSIFAKEGLDIYQLPVWRDIDRSEDVVDLIKQNMDKPFRQSKTMAFLRNCELFTVSLKTVKLI
jgi:rSAM/selenodomain-associated transferase 1